MTIDRIKGLKFVIPGSILMPNDAPATIEVRQRPGKMSRALRPDHWVKEMRRAPLLSFSGSVLVEIRVMSWLHWLSVTNIAELIQSIQQIITLISIDFSGGSAQPSFINPVDRNHTNNELDS
jgi:hypothetical protein